jgi:hypothetical protein
MVKRRSKTWIRRASDSKSDKVRCASSGVRYHLLDI